MIVISLRGYYVVGRFLSTDPLAAEFPMWSTYTYVMDNPVIFVDPTGLSPSLSGVAAKYESSDDQKEGEVEEYIDVQSTENPTTIDAYLVNTVGAENVQGLVNETDRILRRNGIEGVINYRIYPNLESAKIFLRILISMIVLFT